MIPIDYKGKTVLVTGGGRGIGLAITRSFAEAGATLIITYISQDPTKVAEGVSKEFGVPVHVYHCPGGESKIVDEVVEKIAKEVGEINVVVANAGISMWKSAVDVSDDDFSSIMTTNLFAPFYLSRALTRHWLSLPATVSKTSTDSSKLEQKINLDKKILFVSSISGLVAMTPQPQAAYNSSKAGLTMLAKSLAGEWAQYGITVNCISPGYVSTDMIKEATQGIEASYAKKWQEMTPVDRFADPKEVGDMVVLLCSDRVGGFMTGSDVVFDGGYTTL